MDLECRSCLRSIEVGEGLKCGKCASRFHLCCAGVSRAVQADWRRGAAAGDPRRAAWRCNSCRYTHSKSDPSISTILNNIHEKIELINKIQLSKLSNDLQQIRTLVESVSNQNVEVMKMLKQKKHNHAPPILIRRRVFRGDPIWTRIKACFTRKKKSLDAKQKTNK